jgi:hypothetical protein
VNCSGLAGLKEGGVVVVGEQPPQKKKKKTSNGKGDETTQKPQKERTGCMPVGYSR